MRLVRGFTGASRMRVSDSDNRTRAAKRHRFINRRQKLRSSDRRACADGLRSEGTGEHIVSLTATTINGEYEYGKESRGPY